MLESFYGRVGLLLLGLFLLSACRRAETSAPSAPPTPAAFDGIIVAMGNSLTEGLGVAESATYPAQLARKLWADGYPYQVINAGVSGETSSGALSRVEWVLTLEPDIVILETGGNDGLRAIDPTVTAQNLDALITAFRDRDVIVVLAGMKTIQNLGPEYTAAYEAIYPAAAAKHAVIFMPFFLEGVAADPALNQADGIHPTADGYAIVVEMIYPYVLEAIERQQER